jgi:hypothetical protein
MYDSRCGLALEHAGVASNRPSRVSHASRMHAPLTEYLLKISKDCRCAVAVKVTIMHCCANTYCAWHLQMPALLSAYRLSLLAG